MAFNKFPSLYFLASNAPVSSLGFDVRWSENPIDWVASSTRFFHVSQLDPLLLSMNTLSKALNTLDILLSLSSLSGSDTSAPGSGSSGSGGDGEDLGNDDIGDESRSSIGLGGGSTGYPGSGAGTGQTLIPTASSYTHYLPYLTVSVPPQDSTITSCYYPRTRSEPPQLVGTSINIPKNPINMATPDRHAN
ncbi:hypothetical protein EV368DRAFT_85599 [Lentinula lateritia]|nr:hypothetical protein EV368DRAFT_85599 [Lentinula lateritia]